MTSEKLKGKIKSFSEKNNLKAQEVLQMYFFERFLTRLEKSRYRAKFIIKGGFLISSIIGIQNRTTMDIDTTIKGLPVKEEIIKEIILKILSIEVNDGIEFVLGKIENIREISEYENYRLHLTANFEKIKNPLKIDITTGDVIIPSEIEYSYETIFKEKLNILVYSLETLIAEKYETIIKRNITTTRLRDFYDIYMIFKLKNDKINVNNLKQAIRETAKNRNSTEEILESKEILEDIKNDEYLNKQWNIYKNENKYVDNIQFSEILKLLNKIADIVQE
ncbi:nucleotidyl transferase AbiEii/AbiGii toxin family protein [Leptotrichia sp. oral taxon 218]|uniref:nucleotidyl transferase AbiEii/AbiGii toxin family protein n=1 Tax=Leptotrichia sp. oral taxon 218 TaxID=712361 RepID=UPI001B8B49C6|nr:nucleotidyl transferase AbiEii/AbiGii toxin family protein [Leptotrichia sp. oral taxon 218]QUB94829.1 nucleotidyl transferase AbiEii/AbiGii toxin family protein [Leptotrichia sp. oral taxon 218]